MAVSEASSNSTVHKSNEASTGQSLCESYSPTEYSIEQQPDNDQCLYEKWSKYWSIHDSRRYWILMHHCEDAIYTCHYPRLKTPTTLGEYHWLESASYKVPTLCYQYDLTKAYKCTIEKLAVAKCQVTRMIVHDLLLSLDTIDVWSQKTLLHYLVKFIGCQNSLELVSLENMSLLRMQGISILKALSENCGSTLKYLYLWKCFRLNDNPVLKHFCSMDGRGCPVEGKMTKEPFLKYLCQFSNLKLLALNYSYLADKSGHALVSLSHMIGDRRFKLQILCLEEHMPGKANPQKGGGGYAIQDWSWMHLADRCPNIWIQMAFVRMFDYDDFTRYLSRYIPLKEVHIDGGIDLKMKPLVNLGCTIKTLKILFAHHLHVISLNYWREEEPIYLENFMKSFPNLSRFEYIGHVENDRILRKLFNDVAFGSYEKLRTLKIYVQTQLKTRTDWSIATAKIQEEFDDVFKMLEIDLHVSVYNL